MRRPAPLFALLFLALLTPERGEANAAFAFYGTTQTGKTFNRPTEDRTALTGKVVGYGVQPFFVDADATCTLYSVQEFANGLLYLYEGAFDPSAPLQNLIAADDDADLGAGTSAIFGAQLDRNRSYYLVTSAADPGGGGSFSTFVACAGAARVLAGDGSMPAYDGRYSELGKGRFRISATWKDFQGGTGVGRFVPLGSEDSGVIWFFSPSNFEVMIKVLDACSLNNRYWVFFAAVTSVEFTITVYDTFTDTTRTYSNALGVSAPAVTDTDAFQTCP